MSVKVTSVVRRVVEPLSSVVVIVVSTVSTLVEPQSSHDACVVVEALEVSATGVEEVEL